MLILKGVYAAAWHKTVMHYHSYFGFLPVHEVDDGGLRDIPDLQWEGVGQRILADM